MAAIQFIQVFSDFIWQGYRDEKALKKVHTHFLGAYKSWSIIHSEEPACTNTNDRVAWQPTIDLRTDTG